MRVDVTGGWSLPRAAAMLVIGVSVFLPSLATLVDEYLLVAALLLGLPHGAIDDYVEASLSGERRGRLMFYVVYLGSIAFMAALWWLSPMLALTGFLMLAGYHFGEADNQTLPLSERVRCTLTISRAMVVILLPLLVWPELTWPNVAMLLGTELPSAPQWLPSLIAPLLAQHFILYGLFTADAPEALWDTALLSALFLFATPSLSLAVYFGLWHSMRHLEVLRESLGWPSVQLVLHRAAPLTVASVLGLFTLIGGMLWLGQVTTLLVIVLLLISGLTLPHALLTHQLLRRTRPPARPSISRIPGRAVGA